MAANVRITDDLMSEAFRNTANRNGLTSGEIRGYLASKCNMSDLTDKDVRMAIHRAFWDHKMIPKGRGRFLWLLDSGGCYNGKCCKKFQKNKKSKASSRKAKPKKKACKKKDDKYKLKCGKRILVEFCARPLCERMNDPKWKAKNAQKLKEAGNCGINKKLVKFCASCEPKPKAKCKEPKKNPKKKKC